MAKKQQVWAVEVKYTPLVDQRRRLMMRSVPMTLTEAQRNAAEYLAMGWDAVVVDVRDEPGIDERCAA